MHRLPLALTCCSLAVCGFTATAAAGAGEPTPSPQDTAGAATAPVSEPPPAAPAAAPHTSDEQTPAAVVASSAAPHPEAQATYAPEPYRGAAAARTGDGSIVSSSTSVTFGTSVTLSGTMASAAGTALVVEARTGDAWTQVTSTTADADGGWSVVVQPTATATWRARNADASIVSEELTVEIAPHLQLRSLARGRSFVGARFTLRVRPASYTGRVTFAVKYAGRVRARVSVRPRRGRISGMLPAPGLGRMPVLVSAPQTGSHAAATLRFPIVAQARPLRIGSRGPEVAGLLRRMRELRFHVPRSTRRYDHRVGDVVLAFHKAHRMPRTKSASMATWRRLAVAAPMKPRYRAAGRHIEVDKSRQILMLVRNGTVAGTMHVSTGATGNTPEGRWRIYQRGGSYLYRFMAFVGNFGIHGYVPVPAYPASHGCVREPMWAASWTFRNTKMGDRVYVYR